MKGECPLGPDDVPRGKIGSPVSNVVRSEGVKLPGLSQGLREGCHTAIPGQAQQYFHRERSNVTVARSGINLPSRVRLESEGGKWKIQPQRPWLHFGYFFFLY